MTDDLAVWLAKQITEDEERWSAHHADCYLYSVWDVFCDCDGQKRWLAECDSKRRLVEAHKPAGKTSLGDDDNPESWRQYCGTCGSGEPYEYPVWWPCDTLKLLALPYSDRPGYRQEWAP